MRRIRPVHRHSDLPGVLAVYRRDAGDPGSIYGSCLYTRERWHMSTEGGGYTTTRGVNHVFVFDDGRVGLAYDHSIHQALAELGLQEVGVSPPRIEPEPVEGVRADSYARGGRITFATTAPTWRFADWLIPEDERNA